MTSAPVVLVLAAGRGARFHGVGHKLIQALDGATVLETTLRHAVASGLPVVVVTTKALAALAVCGAARAIDVVVLPDAFDGADDVRPNRPRHVDGDNHVAPSLGMGDSIAAGVCAHPNAAGWLVLPADMPRVRPATLRAVADGLASHPVSYACYRGQRGHPVAFANVLYPELAALRGDQGARGLLARHPTRCVEVDDPGVLVDVDTLEDLANLRSPGNVY